MQSLGASEKNDRLEVRTLYALLAVQFICYFFFLSNVPLHYDEWHSLRFFSGNSFWTIISYYPSPNNHVFYNLVSRVFILTGLDTELAVRLPSLFASLLTSYYFFKLCRDCFSSLLSLVLLTYVITLYAVVLYSFMARGYSFLNLCTVLMLYTSLKLSADYSQRKYRLLFIFSQFLGLYTVPSFLYAVVPVYFILAIYVLKQKRVKRIFLFLADGLLSLILVTGAYAFIFYNNDPQNLLNPNHGSNGFSIKDPAAFEKISFYVDTLFFELFDLSKLYVLQILVVITCVYYFVKEREKSWYGLFLSALMFFSPYLILALHQVFPFGRNWLYLVFPTALCVGFMLRMVTANLQTAFVLRFTDTYKPVLCLVIVLCCVFKLSFFGARHRASSAWDYELAYLRKNKLSAEAKRIKEIGQTGSGLEFYPAEVIRFMCEKSNPGKEIRLTPLDLHSDQDLLIINGEELEKYRRKLLRYDFMYENNNIWIYIKKK